MKEIKIFDSTLRDGAQAEGISFSVEDKLKIVKCLDSIGIEYIEAGNPGSNPKDIEFFEKLKSVKMENSKLVAFGSTRRKRLSVEEDSNVQSLLDAGTDVIAIFGKSWDFHVTDIINTTLEQNLKMIYDTIEFFVSKGKEVIFDAEHFYDGYKANSEYAMSALKSAADAGAACLCLCDTNGGTFTDEMHDITKKVVDLYSSYKSGNSNVEKIEIGVHVHNDGGMGVANSLVAVFAGVTHVQGTFIGYGERCGNANLSTIIPNLQVKRGYSCIPEDKIKDIYSTSRFIAEVSNISISNREPYIGSSAFSHKAGMHVDGVSKAPKSFEHMNPEIIGNSRKFITSEVAGKANLLSKIQKIDKTITKDSKETAEIMQKLKEMEHEGYQFEAAEQSFEIVIRKILGKYKPFFELEHYKVLGSQPPLDADFSASAIVKVKVEGKSEITAAEGDGPVNALDMALRKALEIFYPELSKVHLKDFKVRVLDGKHATASKVRVLIESGDGNDTWNTIGVSTDIIEASWIALVDSFEYKLIKDIENKIKAYM